MLRHIAVDDCGRILNPLLVAASSTAASGESSAGLAARDVCDGNPITSN
jgi:CO/xanthine dehydrogenase Mo-binding subunit